VLLNCLIGAYILISTVVYLILPVSEIIAGFILAPHVLLVPILFGRSILYISNLLEDNYDNVMFLISFLLGSSLIVVLSVSMQILKLPATISYFIIVICVILMFLKTIIHKEISRDLILTFDINKIDFKLILSIMIVVIAGLVPALIVGRSRPVGTVGLDHMVGIELVQPINRLIEYGIVDFWKARPMPFLILAIPVISTGISPLTLYWTMPFLLSPLFTLGVFFLVHEITSNYRISIMAALFSAFLNIGWGLFFDSVNFIFKYSTIITALFPWVLCHIYHCEKWAIIEGKNPIPILNFLLAISLLIGFPLFAIATKIIFFPWHWYETTPFVIVGVALLLVFYQRRKNLETSLKSLYFLIGIFLIFIFTTEVIQPLFLNIYGAFVFAYTYILLEKKKRYICNKSITDIFRILTVVVLIYLTLQIIGVIKFNNLSLPFDRTSFIGTQYTFAVKIDGLIKANSEPVLLFFPFVS